MMHKKIAETRKRIDECERYKLKIVQSVKRASQKKSAVDEKEYSQFLNEKHLGHTST